MKAFSRCILIGLLIVSSVSWVHAEGKRPALGWANFALKADYVVFTSSFWKDNDLENAPLIGLEGYGSVYRNLYLGGEIGFAQASGTVLSVNTELTLVPLEMNLKYVFNLSENVKLDLGGGLSYTFAEGKVVSTLITGEKQKDGAWGGQGFLNLNFTFNHFLIGANIKYQATGEILNNANLNNYRGGIQIGYMF